MSTSISTEVWVGFSVGQTKEVFKCDDVMTFCVCVSKTNIFVA